MMLLGDAKKMTDDIVKAIELIAAFILVHQ